MVPVDSGLTESRRLPAMRCSGEGPGSEVVGWRTGFGVAEGRGSLGRLVHGGGERQWGKKVGKPEWWSLVGLEWSGRNSLAVISSRWGRGGPKMVRGVQC
jgi:hypothetical protein